MWFKLFSGYFFFNLISLSQPEHSTIIFAYVYVEIISYDVSCLANSNLCSVQCFHQVEATLV